MELWLDHRVSIAGAARVAIASLCLALVAATGCDGALVETPADAGSDGDADSDADADGDGDADGGGDGGGDADAPLPDGDAPTEDADPPDDGIDVCPELDALRDTGADSAAALQACIDRTAAGRVLELAPGRYSVASQVTIDRAVTVRTAGSAGGPSCRRDEPASCAVLQILPAFDARFGAVRVTGAATLDHLVIDGNRAGRGGTHAHSMCSTLTDNAYGFNGTFECTGCSLTDSVSMNALCGTGFLVTGPASGVTVLRSTFAWNGVHDVRNMWADGLTVHDAADSTFSQNTFVDNTDIDLIFGGCQRCLVQDNSVVHSADPSGGSFAAIMIHKWPTTSGCYEGVEVSGNAVDCGPARACGSGLYIASEGWYPETPYGTLVAGTTSGRIVHNTVVNAMNAIYIGAIGLEIHSNGFLNAHGGTVPSTCGGLSAPTPILVSTTMSSCHFNLENIDPVMGVHYTFGVTGWIGCVPNWPF